MEQEKINLLFDEVIKKYAEDTWLKDIGLIPILDPEELKKGT